MDAPADSLIETDETVLAQVRKDLAHTYARFVARMLASTLSQAPGQANSLFDRLSPPPTEPRGG